MRKPSWPDSMATEDGMGEAAQLSGWDAMVLMVPFVVVLAMGIFHLDEQVATPKHALRSRRFFCGVDPADRPFLSDPDGKLWGRNGVREIEARLERVVGSD